MRFGSEPADILPGGTDNLLLVKAPQASAPGKVPVVVETVAGSSAAYEFTYS